MQGLEFESRRHQFKKFMCKAWKSSVPARSNESDAFFILQTCISLWHCSCPPSITVSSFLEFFNKFLTIKLEWTINNQTFSQPKTKFTCTASLNGDCWSDTGKNDHQALFSKHTIHKTVFTESSKSHTAIQKISLNFPSSFNFIRVASPCNTNHKKNAIFSQEQ